MARYVNGFSEERCNFTTQAPVGVHTQEARMKSLHLADIFKCIFFLIEKFRFQGEYELCYLGKDCHLDKTYHIWPGFPGTQFTNQLIMEIWIKLFVSNVYSNDPVSYFS